MKPPLIFFKCCIKINSSLTLHQCKHKRCKVVPNRSSNLRFVLVFPGQFWVNPLHHSPLPVQTEKLTHPRPLQPLQSHQEVVLPLHPQQYFSRTCSESQTFIYIIHLCLPEKNLYSQIISRKSSFLTSGTSFFKINFFPPLHTHTHRQTGPRLHLSYFP